MKTCISICGSSLSVHINTFEKEVIHSLINTNWIMTHAMKENCTQKQKSHAQWVRWTQFINSHKFFVNQGRRDWNSFPYRRKSYLSFLLWILGTTTLLQCFQILFQMTLYQEAMRLPLSLPVGPRIPASELQPPIWNVFAEAPSAVLENLKGQSWIRFRSRMSSVSGINLNIFWFLGFFLGLFVSSLLGNGMQ